MIKKIARDVSDKLNATPSRNFDGMVGLEAHLRKMEFLPDLNYDGVRNGCDLWPCRHWQDNHC